jgi:riboflavin kinase/FMN adenylyltransferase
MEAARKLLGRSYTLSGRVRHGNKLGRTINFPTMNLRIQDNIATAKGVYAVKLHGINNQILKGVANLGNRPTVDGTETRLEVHVFDFDESVYGQHIEVELETFIRPEQRFADFSALREQIQKDATLARELLH